MKRYQANVTELGTPCSYCIFARSEFKTVEADFLCAECAKATNLKVMRFALPAKEKQIIVYARDKRQVKRKLESRGYRVISVEKYQPVPANYYENRNAPGA